MLPLRQGCRLLLDELNPVKRLRFLPPALAFLAFGLAPSLTAETAAAPAGPAASGLTPPVGPQLDQSAADAELVLLHGWQERFLAKVEKPADPAEGKEGLELLETEGRKLCLAYEKLIGQRRDFLTAYLDYAKFLRKLGEDERAVRVFLEADRLNPKVPVIKQQLSAIHGETGHGPEAVGFILEAIELAPGEAPFHYQLAEILDVYQDELVKKGVYSAAVAQSRMLAAWDEACRLAPDNRSYRTGRARANLDCPSADPAKTLALWEVLQKDAQPGLEADTVRLARAEILFRLKRPDEARTLAQVPVVEPLAKLQKGLLAKLDPQPVPASEKNFPEPIFKEK